MDDDRVNVFRHSLATVMGKAHGRLLFAHRLLEHKSAIAPESAEGHARKLIGEVLESIQGWATDAARLVDVDISDMTKLTQEELAALSAGNSQ